MRKTLAITCGLLAVVLMLALASPADAAMIDIVAAGVNSVHNTLESTPADAINGVGLTGATHDADHKTGWLSPNNAAAVDGSIFVIDLKVNHLLDSTSSLKFWNGKYSGGTVGFKQVKFYLSDDGLTWTDKTAATVIRDSATAVSTYMPQSTGGGLDGTIDFGASATARYIKIQADGGQGTGNWGSGFMGLAEIQAFGTATGQDPVLADRIVPTSVVASSASHSPVVRAIDGTGLTGTGDEHEGGYLKGWLTKDGDGTDNTAYITINLGSPKTIQGMKIWNVCGTIAAGPTDKHETSYGMRTTDIFVSNNGSDWTQVFDDIEISMGDESDNALGDYYDSPFVLDTRSAISGQWQYVKISNEGNANPTWGSTMFVGLGEVQFFETIVPEPATMGLLGLGFAGMATLRRRRRK